MLISQTRRYAAHVKTMLDASAIDVRTGTIRRERNRRVDKVSDAPVFLLALRGSRG